jgi:hypothetical protein
MTPKKYLAFDIETAVDVPGPDFNWRKHRPLGITCAAVLLADEPKPHIWHGQTDGGQPAPRMTPAEAASLATFLRTKVDAGYTIISWNGLSFDFDVLAEESGEATLCRELALNHIDLMFHVFCEKGFPVSLASAAAGLGIPGKHENITAELAPVLWAKGEHQRVFDYVSQDVRMTLDVALASEKRKSFAWKTKAGKTSSLSLKQSWLSVSEALKLPQPDTSWMTNAIPRKQFSAWLHR